MHKIVLTLAAALAACGAEPEKAQGAPAANASAQTGASPAPQPTDRTFRDWLVGCDNGNDCVAFGGALEGGLGWIRVAMTAGPQGRPSIMAGLWASEGPENAAAPLTLEIDGRAFTLALEPDSGDVGTGGVTPGDTAAVLRALAAARSLRVVKGSEAAPLSPNGASAALLWMDERQGRLNTTTALIRRGDRPASAVPAAPALPVVTPAPAADQTGMSPGNSEGPPATLPAAFRNLPAVKECSENLSWNPDLFKGVSRDRLDADTELWGVPCDAGAYNFMMRFWITGPNGSDPRAIALQGVEGDPEYVLTNPEYDPETRTLRQFHKGRGIGDCGTFQKWTWTARGFVLSEEIGMGECWGVPLDLWPTRWRSR